VTRALRDRGWAEQGFTLIEVLVSALLVLIISAGVATALVSATDFTSHERSQSQANAVAQQDQERMKAMSDSQLTSLHQTRTVTLNNTQFKVVSTASFIDASGISSCTSKAEAYFKLSSTITSAASLNNPGQTVTAETIITRPLAGTLLVQVKDQTGTGLSGAAVAVSGQNTSYDASATTDSAGCVAFAGLPTDTYTINATDTGYVDPNGNATATEAAGVNQTNITSPPSLILGAAGAVKVGFVTKGTSVTYDGYTSLGATHGAAPVGYDISYYGAGGGNNMTNNGCLPTSPCTGTGSNPTTYETTSSGSVPALTVGSLFPFYLGSTSQYTNNYQVWAGACAQEEPLQPASSTVFSSPAINTDYGSVTPGKNASTGAPDVYIDEPAVDVGVKYNGGAVVLPAHVSITFSGKNASGTVTCQDTWHQVPSLGPDTVSGTNYAIYPAPFASTASAGSTSPMASANGLAGTISVCADYTSSGTTRHESSPAITTTNFNGPTMVWGQTSGQVMDLKTDTGSLSGPCP
jgi:prepilin-type N-terminal cleavage/methylation domain-containing protein